MRKLECKICVKSIGKLSFKIHCSGGCGSQAHSNCIQFCEDETANGIVRSKQPWICGDCKSKMENKSFKETETGTELNKVTVHGNVKATTTCSPEVCRQARQRFQPPDLASNSPWNQKKTIFFIAIISLLVLWIIVYTVISELKLV